MEHLINKIFRRIWRDIVGFSRDKFYYTYLYRSYWHSLFNKSNKVVNTSQIYFTAQPNLGASIRSSNGQLDCWLLVCQTI